MSKKIAVIGEYMTELSEKGTGVKRDFGGDTLSTSVYIAHQVDLAALIVHYVATLGTDSSSRQMLDAWYGENVDTSLTRRMENRLPDLYYTETDNTGERTFYYWQNEAAAKFWLESKQFAAIYEGLANFDYLYLSRIDLTILSPANRKKLLSLLCECRANGGKVIFDNNYRPRLQANKGEAQQVYQQILEYMDIAFLTLDDEDTLWGRQPMEDAIARTHNANVEEMVVKRGADSCLVSIAGEGLVDVPAVELPKERVIDTTATGDSFSAGCPAVHLTGDSAEDAAGRGYLTASTVIQYRGTIIPHEAMPT